MEFRFIYINPVGSVALFFVTRLGSSAEAGRVGGLRTRLGRELGNEMLLIEDVVR